MPRHSTVVNLDPIDTNKRRNWITRLMVTRYYGGKNIKRMPKYGHYLFAGEQGSGKTASALWYAEQLTKKHSRKNKKVIIYSNIGVGFPIDFKNLNETIEQFNTDKDTVRIIIIDEIHVYYAKDYMSKEARESIGKTNALFSQLRKRQTYILSTSQIYGRLDKSLREQCLYMINCKTTASGKLKNSFIKQEDILVDDLGRWSGVETSIKIHGMSKLKFDTKKIIAP